MRVLCVRKPYYTVLLLRLDAFPRSSSAAFFRTFSTLGLVNSFSRTHPQMKLLLRLRSISLVLLLAVAITLHSLEAARSDYFVNDKDSSGNSDGNFLEKSEYHDCFITIKEIKRIGGQCVKIKNQVQGCVAGNTMIPFHHDCM
ncbi:UNVERIFIED_CONTAM: hypothetical protein PYX00_001149 [Menopon gallinae]|uniref:Uncharacterized protein n=1 Tax=Menopon gallinae TaxID=328185 RepID=A0AAW2IB99_9NEOP